METLSNDPKIVVILFPGTHAKADGRSNPLRIERLPVDCYAPRNDEVTARAELITI